MFPDKMFLLIIGKEIRTYCRGREGGGTVAADKIMRKFIWWLKAVVMTMVMTYLVMLTYEAQWRRLAVAVAKD